MTTPLVMVWSDGAWPSCIARAGVYFQTHVVEFCRLVCCTVGKAARLLHRVLIQTACFLRPAFWGCWQNGSPHCRNTSWLWIRSPAEHGHGKTLSCQGNCVIDCGVIVIASMQPSVPRHLQQCMQCTLDCWCDACAACVMRSLFFICMGCVGPPAPP